jgi:DME family drug/metabolite transporter
MGILLSFCSALAFSINYLAVRIGMKHSPEKDAIMITNLVNFAFLGLLMIISVVMVRQVEWTLSGTFIFVLSGFFTSFLGRLFLFGGIHRIGSAKAVAVKNASPIITVLMAIIWIQEEVALLPSFGMLLIFGGLFVMILKEWRKSGMDLEGKTLRWGIFFALLATLGFGLGQGFRKLGMLYMNEAIVGSWLGVAASLICIVLMNLWKERGKQIVRLCNPQNWNKHFLVAGISSSFALIFFFTALTFVPVAYVSSIAATEPLFTILLSSLFFKRDNNQLTPHFFITVAMVVLGAIFIAVGAG